MKYTAEYLENISLAGNVSHFPPYTAHCSVRKHREKYSHQAHLHALWWSLQLASNVPWPSSVLYTLVTRPLGLCHGAYPSPIDVPCEPVQASSGVHRYRLPCRCWGVSRQERLLHMYCNFVHGVNVFDRVSQPWGQRAIFLICRIGLPRHDRLGMSSRHGV